MKQPGRNDPCWCGSSRKYKKCHLNRESEPPLHSAVLQQRIRDADTVRKCLHPLAAPDACNALVSGHTIQRSRVLKAIVDSGQHVLSFHPEYAPAGRSDEGPYRVGWRQASTIPGFCGWHDYETFAPLEAAEFTGSAEQCFLLGYRALCHEVHEKLGADAAYGVSRFLIDRGHSPEEQRQAQEMLRVHNLGVRKGLEDLMPVKNTLDQALVRRDVAVCSVAVIEFQGPVCLATTGTLTPDVDVHGTRLQVLHDLGTPVEWLSVAVDVAAAGPAVVFCWLRTARKAARFVESILDLTEDRLLALLPQVLLFYLGNTYFAVEWWNQLLQEQQCHLRTLARDPNPYYAERRFLESRIVPWRLLGIRRHDVAEQGVRADERAMA